MPRMIEQIEWVACAERLPEKLRPAGYGLGECPHPDYRGRGRPSHFRCYCGAPKCAVCGFPKHCGAHMHAFGGKPGDPPYDHEYVPAGPRA